MQISLSYTDFIAIRGIARRGLASSYGRALAKFSNKARNYENIGFISVSSITFFSAPGPLHICVPLPKELFPFLFLLTH